MSTDSKTTNPTTPVSLWILFHASGWAFNRRCHFCSPSHLDGEGNGTHSSTLAWKIPGTEEPGRLQSMGSLRVGHD